jgi:hypothetical protein
MVEKIKPIVCNIHCRTEGCEYDKAFRHSSNEEGQTAEELAYKAMQVHYQETKHRSMSFMKFLVWYPEHDDEIDVNEEPSNWHDIAPAIPVSRPLGLLCSAARVKSE